MTHIDKYMDWLEHGRKFSKNTLKAVRHDLEMFDGNIDEALRYEFEAFIMQQNKKGMSSATVNRRISTMRNYMQWLIDNEIRNGKNPITNGMTPRVRHKHHKGVSKEELDNLYNKSSDDVKYFIALAGYTGMRISEVVSVNEILYEDDKPYIHLKDTKNGYDRKVSLALVPDFKLVKRYVDQGGVIGQRGKLTANALYRRVVKETGLKPHDFRATFSKLLMDKDVNVNVLRTMLGHTASGELGEVTARYVGEATIEKQAQALKEVFNT